MKTAPASNSATSVRRLMRHIRAVRRKRFAVKTLTGGALALSILVGGFTAEAILDRLVNLPWLARALVFLGCLGCTAYFLWKESIKPLRKRIADDNVALLIEHALPEFRTRFIASIQLARDAETRASSLVKALVAQTVAMANSLSFKNVVKTARLKRLMKTCTGITAVACALFFLGGGASVLLLKRAMLFNVPLPGWTYLVSVTGDKNVGFGEDLKIEVTAGGIIPSQGRVITTSATGQKREFTLTADASQHGRFNAVVRSPQEAFSYIVKLGDATSAAYNVKTFKRPTVADVACEQVFPDYLDDPPMRRQVSDLSLLVGSHLKVTLKASMAISKAALRLAGLDREVPMQVDAKDPTVLHGEIEIPPKDLTGFSARLVSTDGVESGEGVVYHIDVVPDREPTVKIVAPTRREEAATSQAVLRIAFEAKDDFGISKASLHFNVDQGAEKTIEFDMGQRAEKTVTRRFEWKLSSLQPHAGVGSTIEFWITVADNNSASGPGAAATEHYQTKIVTDEEKRLDIANRLRETMSGLNEIEASQQELNKNLGEPLFEKQKQNP
ncbi:MAG: hypothetical protein PHQ12_14230 [Chthoniobacteraceae bacterium]|nr:hypothetical protein [Chthoniobacteraceae bacterium]